MKIIDRYILKKFLSTFVFVVFILVAIVGVIDFTEKNDKFIQHGLTAAEILPYYAAFLPFVASLITPITVFIATVFVTAKLAGQTEIIAILASGVSFRRLMVPYLIGAILIASFSFYLNGWIIPDGNKYRVDFEVAYVKKPYYYDERNVHIKIGPEEYAYMERYNNNANVGFKFTMERIRDHQVLEKIEAARIEWDTTQLQWKLVNWEKREIDGFDERISFGKELDTTLSIHPNDFANNYRLHETFTIPELDRHITKLRDRGADDVEIYEIEKYVRYMTPFTVLILTFIGLIVSARKARGGTGFQIALGFLIAFIFIIFFIMSRAIAEAGTMNPLVAIWTPNVIFSIIGLVMYKTVPR